MFGIPESAFSVGMIILFGAAGIALLVRLLPPDNRRRALSDEQQQMLDDLQARLGELDAMKERIGELEERADFAERLLARQREAPQLGPAQSE